jgi:hypothetical protein
MATPFNPTHLPPNPQPAPSPRLNPQLIPLLDLIADLIAQDIWTPLKALNERLGEVFDANAPASVQASSSSGAEKPGKTGPFHSFPADSHPECLQNPNNHPHADEP